MRKNMPLAVGIDIRRTFTDLLCIYSIKMFINSCVFVKLHAHLDFFQLLHTINCENAKQYSSCCELMHIRLTFDSGK